MLDLKLPRNRVVLPSGHVLLRQVLIEGGAARGSQLALRPEVLNDLLNQVLRKVHEEGLDQLH